MDTEYAPIVIDNGAGFMRVGFGGDDNPKSIFRKFLFCLLRCCYDHSIATLVSGDRTYGEEALVTCNVSVHLLTITAQ
jgi:actin-related protein